MRAHDLTHKHRLTRVYQPSQMARKTFTADQCFTQITRIRKQIADIEHETKMLGHADEVEAKRTSAQKYAHTARWRKLSERWGVVLDLLRDELKTWMDLLKQTRAREHC